MHISRYFATFLVTLPSIVWAVERPPGTYVRFMHPLDGDQPAMVTKNEGDYTHIREGWEGKGPWFKAPTDYLHFFSQRGPHMPVQYGEDRYNEMKSLIPIEITTPHPKSEHERRRKQALQAATSGPAAPEPSRQELEAQQRETRRQNKADYRERIKVTEELKEAGHQAKRRKVSQQ